MRLDKVNFSSIKHSIKEKINLFALLMVLLMFIWYHMLIDRRCTQDKNLEFRIEKEILGDFTKQKRMRVP